MGWFWSTRIGRVLAAAGAFALLVAAAWFKGRRDGAQAAENRHVRRRVEAMQEAMEVRDDVQSRSDDAVRDDLSRWMRD